MKVEEARVKYIQTWGALATHWGVSRTMAQVYALLLSTAESLTTEEVMEQLSISRGNANMNLRALIDWGIVEKDLKIGERKEYFFAQKDMWELFKQVAKERKRREIDPVLDVLDELSQIEDNSEDAIQFKKTMMELSDITKKANAIIEMASKMDKHFLESGILGQMLK